MKRRLTDKLTVMPTDHVQELSERKLTWYARACQAMSGVWALLLITDAWDLFTGGFSGFWLGLFRGAADTYFLFFYGVIPATKFVKEIDRRKTVQAS